LTKFIRDNVFAKNIVSYDFFLQRFDNIIVPSYTACLTLAFQAELRDEIVAKETSNSESPACVEECLRKRYEQDVEYYKDQICRQEATISAHQERLGRVLKVSRRVTAKRSQQQGLFVFFTNLCRLCEIMHTRDAAIDVCN